MFINAGADLGGGGDFRGVQILGGGGFKSLGGGGGERVGRPLFPQGFDSLPTPLVLLRNPVLADQLKNFPKAPLAQIYTNFEGGGGARAEKSQFFGQNFPKSA